MNEAPAEITPSHLPPVARSSWRRRGIAALATFVALSALCLRVYFPPLPTPLALDLEIKDWTVGRSEPLITGGRREAADFLFVRYVGPDSLAIGYEPWGHPSDVSTPVRVARGERVHLEVAMPALTQIRGVLAPPTNRLFVRCNGVVLFDKPVEYHVRYPGEIYFAENPAGGTACEPELSGRLFRPADGKEVRGYPTRFFTLPGRVASWILVSRWQAIFIVATSVCVFFVLDRRRWPKFVRFGTSIINGGRTVAEHRWGGQLVGQLWTLRWFLGTAAVATFGFAWMVTYGTFKLNYAESFGVFYDYQAVSILHGRLDVPDEAIGGEAFIFDGRRYGYFGITPSLLRIPFVVFDIGFGKLSRSLMLLYFAGCLVAAYLLLREALRFAGREPTPSRWATVCFIGSVGLGSTLFFLGSRAYIYHEAILCGIVFALFACWCALRHIAAPHGRWWIGALVCAVLSVHARPPTGLFALTFVGGAAVAIAIRQWNTPDFRLRQLLGVVALCGVGLFSFNAVSYLKFRTFDGSPLRYNVQYTRERLARIDGKNFHLSNLPIAIDSYLLRPNFHFEPRFPYFYFEANHPPPPFRHAKIDYHDKTLAFPYAMPAVFGLAAVGGLCALGFVRKSRLLVVLTWAAALPMSFAMFAAIAIVHRYTGDFCPALIVAAAFGVVGIEAAPAWLRGLLKFTIGIAAVAGVLITLALTLHCQGHDIWGVPPDVQQKYEALRNNIDGAVDALRR